MRTAVIALSKIGLPLAVQFAGMGHEVVGVDVRQTVMDKVNAGTEPPPGGAHLQEKLSVLVPARKSRATCDYSEAILGVDAIVVAAPLFVNGETWQPDFGQMEAVIRSFVGRLTPSTLISYETTLLVSTTRNRWRPMIEETSGLEEGKDLRLVFFPERMLTGRVFGDLRRYPKLVDGLSSEDTAKGINFYEQILTFGERPDLPQGSRVWDVGLAEVAEMAKLAEATYRDANIGLASRFGKFAAAYGTDVHKVADAPSSQSYSHIHRPGITAGGRYIPVYPCLCLHTGPGATIMRTAREANITVPRYTIGLVEGVLDDLKGRRVVVLGASYWGRVKEIASSGMFPTIEILKSKGVKTLVHGPMYINEEPAAFRFTPCWLDGPVDAVTPQVDHPKYLDLIPTDLFGTQVVIDGRDVLGPTRWKGVAYRSIGDDTTR